MANPLLLIATALLVAAGLLATVRLILGPSGPDRAVALDGMTIMSVSLIAVIAVMAQRIIYLDVALVYALVSFLGIVALARYLERGL